MILLFDFEVSQLFGIYYSTPAIERIKLLSIRESLSVVSLAKGLTQLCLSVYLEHILRYSPCFVLLKHLSGWLCERASEYLAKKDQDNLRYTSRIVIYFNSLLFSSLLLSKKRSFHCTTRCYVLGLPFKRDHFGSAPATVYLSFLGN